MCESTVFLLRDDERERVMGDVVRMEAEDGGVRIWDIMGQEMLLEGARLAYADLMSHEIVLVTE